MSFSLPNSTQIPNEIINGWLPKLSAAELKVVIIVARQTLGWVANSRTGMRKEEDWMTNSQIKLKTGIRDKATLSGAIKGLIDKKLIEIRTNNGVKLDTPQKRQKAGREHKKFYYRLKMKTMVGKSTHGMVEKPNKGHGGKIKHNKTNSLNKIYTEKKFPPSAAGIKILSKKMETLNLI